jgi:hypothetical protein
MSDGQASQVPELVTSRQVTLLEVLDRLLETGAVMKGKVLLSVADVDLVYLGLQMVLASVATLEEQTGIPAEGEASTALPERASAQPVVLSSETDGDSQTAQRRQQPTQQAPRPQQPAAASRERADDRQEPGRGAAWKPQAHQAQPKTDEKPLRQPRLDIDPENVERGLAKLVLTVVELLRRLMENQAVRRMEHGSLSAEQVERLGKAFSVLERRMEDLKKVFGLEDEELNLDLGPIGKLV